MTTDEEDDEIMLTYSPKRQGAAKVVILDSDSESALNASRTPLKDTHVATGSKTTTPKNTR